MEIKNLSDSNLVIEAKKLVKEERRITLEVLKFLREIDRRRLYSDYKCSSLKEFAMKEFEYSSDEAESRITAMRVIKDVPLIEEKVKSGELSMTHLKLAQNFFNNEKRKGDGEYSKEEKLEFLEELSHTSTREAQKIIFQESTAPMELIPDRVKEISQECLEFKFVGSLKLKNLIDQSKGLLAHKNPGASLNEILEMALERLVENLDPSRTKTQKKKAEKQATKPERESSTEVEPCIEEESLPPKPVARRVAEKPATETASTPDTAKASENTSVPRPIARQVYARAKNKCENCQSFYALQIEHVHPRALGGTHDLENLKLLCRSCNLRQAVKIYGTNKMEGYQS